jgi:hypothetical protein
MTFWVEVLTTYAVIVAVGLAVGALLASRFPGRGNGGPGGTGPLPTEGPTFGAEVGFEPLGSDFDRMLLPMAFAESDALV